MIKIQESNMLIKEINRRKAPMFVHMDRCKLITNKKNQSLNQINPIGLNREVERAPTGDYLVEGQKINIDPRAVNIEEDVSRWQELPGGVLDVHDDVTLDEIGSNNLLLAIKESDARDSLPDAPILNPPKTFEIHNEEDHEISDTQPDPVRRYPVRQKHAVDRLYAIMLIVCLIMNFTRVDAQLRFTNVNITRVSTMLQKAIISNAPYYTVLAGTIVKIPCVQSMDKNKLIDNGTDNLAKVLHEMWH